VGPLSRRGFLGKGSMTIAAAGLLASAPVGAVTALLGSGEAPALEDETTDLTELGSALDGPVVAHIRDLAAGEISVFAGEREVVIRDAAVAARLLRAIK
jgi:3-hydroxyisobutyrate dehydrogenase-like beta-hydroxyacid dehydrogenase